MAAADAYIGSLTVEPAMFARLSAVALLASLVVASAQASPCAAPGDYLRASASAAQRQPLVRPFVLEGLAVTALHQRGDQAWLELAVDSESTARRALSAQGGDVQTVAGAVLVSCRGLPAAAQRRVALAQPVLW
jgi:hypothetical protein